MSCEQAGIRKPEQTRLEGQGWEPSAGPPGWGEDVKCSDPGEAGLRRPGWNEKPRSGFAAGAGSAESVAGGPSSRHTLAAPCGRTDGQPVAADAGTPAAQRKSTTASVSISVMLILLHYISQNASLTASLSLSMIVSSSSKCRNLISSFFIWVSTSKATRDLIFLSSTAAKCFRVKQKNL